MEIFKDVIGYEGIYQISNLGNIKSLSRCVVRSNNRNFITKTKINKNHICDTGYYAIRLKKLGVSKIFKVHRLIAVAFMPNTENKPQINHIDGNKLNNDISNLEWCTNKENAIHAYKNKLSNPSTKIAVEFTKVKVIDTVTDITYNSIIEASKAVGYSRSHTSLMLNGTKTNKTTLKYK